MSDLAVELGGAPLGVLSGAGAGFDLVPGPDAGGSAQNLSVALPRGRETRARRGARQGYFRELLPEGASRVRLAELAGVATHDVVGMLAAYGLDAPGAVQARRPGERLVPRAEPLPDGHVGELLAGAASHPLADVPPGGRSTLPGVQPKIVLTRTAGGWARAVDGYPSTHILKPAGPSTTIYDEEYGARLARRLGLASFRTQIQEIGGVAALVVERFDRAVSADGVVVRTHQEDFNQALGIPGDAKYQRSGGRASLARVAKVLTATAGDDALRRLARRTVLTVAVGDLDMHTKNLALVHGCDGSVDLAPTYDVVPQAHRPGDGELALAVGGVYRHAAVTRADLVAEIAGWGVRDARRLVDETLTEILAAVAHEVPHPRAHAGLREDVTRFGGHLLAGASVGPAGRPT